MIASMICFVSGIVFTAGRTNDAHVWTPSFLTEALAENGEARVPGTVSGGMGGSG